jgi:tRNA (adenine-N(1)-)-methyltransferase non-catalytic subunit
MPSSTISIPKIGTFSANLLLGRPYHFTYELQDQTDGSKDVGLRIVPAAELNFETVANLAATPDEFREDTGTPIELEAEVTGRDGEKNNRLTIDDPSRQGLTMEEIEELKKADAGSGKEIISRIMASHAGIKEKTAFALAKYALRKHKKYMKRFTVLPLDVSMLIEVMLEKDSSKILEIREDIMGLIMSWSNVHHGGAIESGEEGQPKIGSGRWLVVDDTAGLVVAALAERMGLLYKHSYADNEEISDEEPTNGHPTSIEDTVKPNEAIPESEAMQIDRDPPDTIAAEPSSATNTTPSVAKQKPRRYETSPQLPSSNTITVIHANSQPNLSFLKYFSYTPEDPASSADHPLHNHLKTVTWLQLINPTEDTLYQEPEKLSEAALASMKSGKRGHYYRKRNRWEKIKSTVDETRAGGFDGLVVASTMEPTGSMKHCVPLVRGGGNIVVYSPSVEPLTMLMDLYSRDRRGAYVRAVQAAAAKGKDPELDEQLDFPLNPTLLLNPMLQTARAREWQVLPGRTHPLMTSRGGSEGYLFTATRVLPKEGMKVEARGNFAKKRKAMEAGAAKEIDGVDEMEAKKVKADETGREEIDAAITSKDVES